MQHTIQKKTATSFCLRKTFGAALSTCYYHWSPFSLLLLLLLLFFYSKQFSRLFFPIPTKRPSHPHLIPFVVSFEMKIDSRLFWLKIGPFLFNDSWGCQFQSIKIQLLMWLCVALHMCAPIDMQSMHRMLVRESMHLSHIPLCMLPSWRSVTLLFHLYNSDPFPPFSSNCLHLMDFKLKRHLFVIFATYATIVPIRQLLKCLAQRVPKMHSFCGWIDWNGISTKETSVC